MSNLPLFDPPPVDDRRRWTWTTPRAPFAVRSASQRRARSLGRDGQDHRPGAPLREPAEGGRRAVEHPRDHLHAQGRDRDARADRPRAADAPRRGRSSTRRAGSRCAIASPRSRSARSTRSACRCCASSRSRRTSIPASTWPTRPRCRASSTSRSTARCGSSRALAKEDPDIALVHRAARRVADAGGAGVAARSASRRVGRARPLPRRAARRT